MTREQKSPTLADRLIRMRKQLQEEMPRVLVNFDIVSSDKVRIQIYGYGLLEGEGFARDYPLNSLTDNDEVDHIIAAMVDFWEARLEGI